MNRKQLTLILVAVVVIGGLGLWLRSRQKASFRTTEGRMGQKVLGEFDANLVAQLVIKQGSNQVTLAKQEEQWVVRERANYPANFSELSDFLRKLADLKIVQSVAIGPSQLGRLELLAPGTGEKAGTLVELRNKDSKPLKTLLLGKKHMRQAAAPSQFGGDEGWPDGRYLMLDGQAQTTALVSENFSNIEPKPDQWLNKDFFKVEKVKSVSVTYTNATNSWKVFRDTEAGELKLVDAKPEEKLDSSKASGIPNALSYPSFVDVAADAKPEATGLDKPTVAMLETFDNFTYTVKIGNKTPEDNYYLAVAVTGDFPKERTPGKDEKPEDKEKLDKEFKEKTQKLVDKLKQEKAYDKVVYTVSKYTVDSLLKERAQLMVEKKDEPAKTAETSGATNAPPPFPVVPIAPPAPAVVVPPKPPATTNALDVLPPLPPVPTTEPATKPAEKKP